MTDRFGICVDGQEEVVERVPPRFEIELEGYETFPPLDVSLKAIFAEAGIERLGGASSGRGWTSISTYQRCPYLWRRKYIDPDQGTITGIDPPARAIGTLIHTYLAIYYRRMIDPTFSITPEQMHNALIGKTFPEYLTEAWRVFVAYTIYYQQEEILPLAVEHNAIDPRTGESCRYDLIAFFPNEIEGRPAGTYEIEHKSTGRFDQAALAWANDGEVIGQVMLWERLSLDKRFGPLRGAIVNILGKQQEPKFHRTYVAAESWLTKQHARDLKSWEGFIQLSRASGHFPRSRGNCKGQWGLCDLYDECSASGLED